MFANLTVLENLKVGAYLRKDKAAEKDIRSGCMSCSPRLEERHWQLAGTLSGGEQQMLAVGRALMSRPKLLMLDEPSLGLAPLVVQGIFDIIRTVNEQGITVLLIEQNANMALKIADYAYVLETGNITKSGTGAELLHRCKADRAAHRAVHRVQSGHHQSAGEFRPARADGVVRGVPDRAGGVLPAFAKRVKLDQPGLAAGLVCSAFSGCCAALHHRRAYDGAVFRRHRPEQGDVCGRCQIPVLYHQPHQLHHADGAGLFQRGTAAYGGAGYGVHPAGAVDRYRLSRKMSGDVARQVVYIGVGISGLVTLIQELMK